MGKVQFPTIVDVRMNTVRKKIFKIVQTDGIIIHMMNKTALNRRGPKGEQLIKRLSLLIQILAGIVQLVPKTT
jgi:hypothetical protein